MKIRHRIAPLSLAMLLCFCLAMPAPASAKPAEIGPQALASLAADLSRSGNQLYKYGRGATTNSTTIYYTVALQQKAIWPWSQYADYEASSGSNASGSFTYGAYTSPPTGYFYRVAVYASGAGFGDMEVYSNEIFY